MVNFNIIQNHNTMYIQSSNMTKINSIMYNTNSTGTIIHVFKKAGLLLVHSNVIINIYMNM